MSIHVTLSQPVTANLTSLLPAVPRVAATIGSAANQGPADLVGNSGEVWTVRAFADLFVEFGANPTGSGSLRHAMAAGEVRQWACTQAGQRVAFALT